MGCPLRSLIEQGSRAMAPSRSVSPTGNAGPVVPEARASAVTRLAPADAEVFFAAMLQPPEPTEALIDAVALHRRIVVSSE